MAQINKPSDYFNTKLYTGNGTDATGITGVGFQPDWVWIKERSSTSPHKLLDAVRGATKELESNSTNAEATEATSLQSFDSDGFTVGTNGAVNENSQTYASWNWLGANGTASNTDGDITSTVSANTTSGFSIVNFTTNASSGGATIGHGLGSVPKMIIMKALNATYNWDIYHVINGNDHRMIFTTSAKQGPSSDYWNNTTPTSSVFSINQGFYGTGISTIAYCFAEKKGFSKFGSYVGNGDAPDGTFVYTGFKPAFVMGKATSGTENWFMNDNKRLGYNDKNYRLYPNLSNNEATDINMDIFSNGFKLNSTNGNSNGSGITYIYMAFAEEPLVGDNPATAR
jgi:hypothetical protein